MTEPRTEMGRRLAGKPTKHRHSWLDGSGDCGLCGVARSQLGFERGVAVGTPTAAEVIRVEDAARTAALTEMEAAIRAIPSQAMDTLVPNTGPDVVARDDFVAGYRLSPGPLVSTVSRNEVGDTVSGEGRTDRRVGRDDEHHPACCGACDECDRICSGYHGPERRAAVANLRSDGEATSRHHNDCIGVWWDAYTHRRGSKKLSGLRYDGGSSCPCWCHRAALDPSPPAKETKP